MAEKTCDLEERSRVALGALLSTIDINPSNLHRLKADIPDQYICKQLIEVAFAQKQPRDLSPAFIKQVSSQTKLNASIDGVIGSAMLSCDLLLLAEEQQIKSGHPYFLQSCSNLRKGIKQTMGNVFREVLSLPLASLEQSQTFSSFMDFMFQRLLPNNRVLSMPAIIEAFLVTLAYKTVESEELLSKVVHALGVFWASTDKQGSNIVELAENCSVILDKCLKGDSSSYGVIKKPEDIPTQHIHKGGNTKGELAARDKIEETVLNKEMRLLEPEGLKFGYVLDRVPQIILAVIEKILENISTESMLVNIEPLIRLINTISSLTMEQVAFSDSLVKVRSALKLKSISLAKVMTRVFAGAYQDVYPVLFSELRWKSESIESIAAYMDLLTTFFTSYPRNFHQSIVFEEPNLLQVIPKLLVWTEKHQVDNSTSHLAKAKKQGHQKERISTGLIVSGWLENATKVCTPDAVYHLRILAMRYLKKYFSLKALALSPAHKSKLLLFNEALCNLSKMASTFTAQEGELYVDIVVLSGKVASLRDLVVSSTLEDTVALCQTARLFNIDASQTDLDEFVGARTTVEGSKSWHEYLQNIVNETKAKYIKKSRLEALQNNVDEELRVLDEDDEEMKTAPPPTASGFGNQFANFGSHAPTPDIWEDSRSTPQEQNHHQENGSTPFTPMQNSGLTPDGRKPEFQKPQQMNSRPSANDKLKAWPPSDESTLVAKKKQLFASESEDEEMDAKVEARRRKSSSESREKGLGKRQPLEGSPIASVGFSDLGEAPAFTF